MQTLITQLAKEKTETKNKEHWRRINEKTQKINAVNNERMRKDGFAKSGKIDDQDMLHTRMRDDADYLQAEVARKVEFSKKLRSMNEHNL